MAHHLWWTILFLDVISKLTEPCKLNVVLFLAKTSTTESYVQDSGIKFLNFQEKSRVKHCATGNTDIETSYTAPGTDCKQLLQSAIFALVTFCRNVMGMTTAIASLENDTFTNGLRFKKSTREDLEIRYFHPQKLPNFAEEPIQHETPTYITEPEHTEVFKIRTKRQVEDFHQFDAPSEDDPNWDVFGVVANIKLTFFGKLFDESFPKPMEHQDQMMNKIGKVCGNGIFDLVKDTLTNLQDCGKNGFLMVVVGGNLNEICDIYSSLMQSVKYVIENTNEDDTLIVVTGACPLIDNTNYIGNNQLFPVYVKGPPKTDSLSTSEELYDIPFAIKTLLTDLSGGEFKRSKREISVGVKNGLSLTISLWLIALFL